MEKFVAAKRYADYLTVTCLEWLPLLKDDCMKDIIIDSLSFLTKNNRVSVYAFVIMSNHFHLIWQILGNHRRDAVQRDFLKFTAQQILRMQRGKSLPILDDLQVNAKDRKYQVWERNSLSVPIWSEKFLWEKLEYIHNNPVRAGLCKYPEDYRYSSAGFYYNGDRHWKFLVHCDG
jgi:putative transposase